MARHSEITTNITAIIIIPLFFKKSRPFAELFSDSYGKFFITSRTNGFMFADSMGKPQNCIAGRTFFINVAFISSSLVVNFLFAFYEIYFFLKNIVFFASGFTVSGKSSEKSVNYNSINQNLNNERTEKQIDNLLYRAKKELRTIIGKEGELLL